MTSVIDTSVLLQVVRGEPGADAMLPRLRTGCISAVNLAEAIDTLVRKGAPRTVAEAAVKPLVFAVVPFDEAAAWQAGAVREAAAGSELSLGDVACLATARALQRTALTNDRAWADHDYGIPVELGRPVARSVH